MERNSSIDLLKTIAIIGVIIIHTCSGGYVNPIPSFDWVSSVFWGSIVRASVPLFFMCSGALLLNPHKELSLKKLYTKNLLKIVVAMIVWAMAYKVYHLYTAGTLCLSACYHALKQVLLFEQEFHLYYLHIIIIVYVFLPITRVFIKNASRKELIYALAVWFLLGIVYPTIRFYPPFNMITGIPVQWAMNMTYSAIGYGILGYYLSCYPPRRTISAFAVGALGFLSVFGLTVYMSIKSGYLYQNFFEGMSIGVSLLAAGIFGVCTRLSPKQNGITMKIVTRISKASFCIYLFHVFIIYFFMEHNITVSFLPTLISIPLVALLNFALSYCCYFILSKIPVINKWLI